MMDDITKMCWEELSDALAKQLGYKAVWGRGKINVTWDEDTGEENFDMGEGWCVLAPDQQWDEYREVYATEQEAWEDAPNLLSIYAMNDLPFDSLLKAAGGYIAVTDEVAVWHPRHMRAIVESVYRAKLGQRGDWVTDSIYCPLTSRRCSNCHLGKGKS